MTLNPEFKIYCEFARNKLLELDRYISKDNPVVSNNISNAIESINNATKEKITDTDRRKHTIDILNYLDSVYNVLINNNSEYIVIISTAIKHINKGIDKQFNSLNIIDYIRKIDGEKFFR